MLAGIFSKRLRFVEFGRGLGEKRTEGKKEVRKYLSPHPLGQLEEH